MQNKKQPPRPGAETQNTLPRRPAQFGGFSPRPVMTPRPGAGMMRPMPGAIKPKPTARDKEMEDTLKKLKEMSE